MDRAAFAAFHAAHFEDPSQRSWFAHHLQHSDVTVPPTAEIAEWTDEAWEDTWTQLRPGESLEQWQARHGVQYLTPGAVRMFDQARRFREQHTDAPDTHAVAKPGDQTVQPTSSTTTSQPDELTQLRERAIKAMKKGRSHTSSPSRYVHLYSCMRVSFEDVPSSLFAICERVFICVGAVACLSYWMATSQHGSQIRPPRLCLRTRRVHTLSQPNRVLTLPGLRAPSRDRASAGGARTRVTCYDHSSSFSLYPYLLTMSFVRAVVSRSAALRAAQPTLRRFNSFTPNPEAAKAFIDARQHAFEHAARMYPSTQGPVYTGPCVLKNQS